MANLDNRRVRLGIEVGNSIKYFEGLNIYASGTKYASGIQNEIDVKITNLSKADRDYIMTETSPYNKNRTQQKKLILEAG